MAYRRQTESAFKSRPSFHFEEMIVNAFWWDVQLPGRLLGIGKVRASDTCGESGREGDLVLARWNTFSVRKGLDRKAAVELQQAARLIRLEIIRICRGQVNRSRRERLTLHRHATGYFDQCRLIRAATGEAYGHGGQP